MGQDSVEGILLELSVKRTFFWLTKHLLLFTPNLNINVSLSTWYFDWGLIVLGSTEL